MPTRNLIETIAVSIWRAMDTWYVTIASAALVILW